MHGECAAAVGNEYRVFGPPGTGKTSTLIRMIARGIELHGAGRIFVTSYTKAAAQHLVDRVKDYGLDVDRSRIGTLHAHCYRILDRPTLAETKVEEWNERSPHLKLSSSSGGIDVDDPMASDGHAGEGRGDELLGRAQLCRARLIPRDIWPTSVRDFDAEWRTWKEEAGYLDFTDLLEVCLRDVKELPGAPLAAYVDEVQDLKPLELTLLRKWCSGMEQYVLAGDDDQCIYQWAGASPDALLDRAFDPERDRILKESFRVPAAVHRVAQNIVSQISRRQEKHYLPTGDPGLVTKCNATSRNIRPLVDELEERIEAGRTCMALASCAYMLQPLIAELRKRGLPFANHYRPRRGDWNPMSRGREGRRTALDRIGAFLSTDPEFVTNPQPEWRWSDIALWSQDLQVHGQFRTGWKTHVSTMAADPDRRDAPVDVFDLAGWMQSGTLERALDHDLAWFRDSLLPAKKKAYELAVEVALRRGKKAIAEAPKLTIGTIHSVKGGEASCVAVLPDISHRGAERWLKHGPEGRDEILRQFYVAVTRAQHELIVCQGGTRLNFPLARFAA